MACIQYAVMIYLNVQVKLIELETKASSAMRALSRARCTDARLYTIQIKIGTNQRALGELSHC